MVDKKPTPVQSVRMALGAAIRAMRGADPQDRLADVTRVKQATISRWEHGKSTPTIEQMIALEDLYDRPRGSLLRDAGVIEAIDSTEKAIAAATELTPEWRRALLTIYRSAVADGASAATAATTTRRRRK